MKHALSFEGLFKAVVAAALLVMSSPSSWSKDRLDNVSESLQAADEAARSRGHLGQPAACRDTTPHTARFVQVEPGVRLQVLDWGGAHKPRTMVLLTGLGDNAHVYDDFAFHFTDHFHVVGMTRRGFRPSSQPEHGYDVETRARDVIAVLDALGIGKATFVGHSLAGSELSKIAEVYKSRVDKVVYLDAHDLAEFPPPSTLGLPLADSFFTSATTKSLWAYQAAVAKYVGLRRSAPAVCHSVQFDAHGAIGELTTPDWVIAKLQAGVVASANPPVNWINIDAPRLGIFAQNTLEARQPWYGYLTAAEQAQFDKAWPVVAAWQHETIAKFAHNNPVRPLVLPAAQHYVYLSNETDVVRAMWEFLALPIERN